MENLINISQPVTQKNYCRNSGVQSTFFTLYNFTLVIGFGNY